MPTTLNHRETGPDGYMRQRVTVPAGETSPHYLVAPSGRVAVRPGASGAMKVQVTGSPVAVLNANVEDAIWEDWDAGMVSVATSERYDYATAVRFVAAAGGAASIGEIAS